MSKYQDIKAMTIIKRNFVMYTEHVSTVTIIRSRASRTAHAARLEEMRYTHEHFGGTLLKSASLKIHKEMEIGLSYRN